MSESQELYLVFIALLALERLLELVVSSRNARAALARGAVEAGRGHYRVMVVLHALFLVACPAEVIGLGRAFPGAFGFVALGGEVLAQALRWWAIGTLGSRWSTRVIVLPDVAPVTGGPYRFLRHPNYLAVVLEIACVPLVHGAWLAALVFSAANALLLAVRIRCEERALGPGWARAFADKSRLVPRATGGDARA